MEIFTFPADYVKFVRKLLDALRDSIETDLSPASENEVMRRMPCSRAGAINLLSMKSSGCFKMPISNQYPVSDMLSAISICVRDLNLSQVRRKADPAKALVKEWVQNWRDARAVSSEVSYRKITGAVSRSSGVHMQYWQAFIVLKSQSK